MAHLGLEGGLEALAQEAVQLLAYPAGGVDAPYLLLAQRTHSLHVAGQGEGAAHLYVLLGKHHDFLQLLLQQVGNLLQFAEAGVLLEDESPEPLADGHRLLVEGFWKLLVLEGVEEEDEDVVDEKGVQIFLLEDEGDLPMVEGHLAGAEHVVDDELDCPQLLAGEGLLLLHSRHQFVGEAEEGPVLGADVLCQAHPGAYKALLHEPHVLHRIQIDQRSDIVKHSLPPDEGLEEGLRGLVKLEPARLQLETEFIQAEAGVAEVQQPLQQVQFKDEVAFGAEVHPQLLGQVLEPGRLVHLVFGGDAESEALDPATALEESAD